jgi:hypothetical protein
MKQFVSILASNFTVYHSFIYYLALYPLALYGQIGGNILLNTGLVVFRTGSMVASSLCVTYNAKQLLYCKV